jgi:hypothetical protein
MTEAEKRQRLRRIRLAAVSAVALMLALFLASSLLRDRYAAALRIARQAKKAFFIEIASSALALSQPKLLVALRDRRRDGR